MLDHPWVNLLSSLIAAVPALLAFGQGLRNGHSIRSVATKADEIHVLTNSAMSTLKADLALANQRIEQLQNLVNDLTSKASTRLRLQ